MFDHDKHCYYLMYDYQLDINLIPLLKIVYLPIRNY